MAINDFSPELSKHHNRWKRNRDFLAGADTVKGKREKYFPKPTPEMEQEAFDLWLNYVTFFPAARRTAQGFLGLMFRKQPVFAASPFVTKLAEAINSFGDRHFELAYDVTEEVLATDLVGLHVDYPQQPEGITIAAAERGGYRPFINHYVAESILGYEHKLIRNQLKLFEVRLLEDEGKQVRQLKLEDGIYTVTIHTFNGKEWIAEDPVIPKRNNQPLDHIPFFIITSSGDVKPGVAVMDDVVGLNHNHYLHQGELTSVYRFIGRPIPYVINAKAPEEGWSIRGGVVWEIESSSDDHKPEVGFNNMPSDGCAALIDQREHLEDQMAKVGARLLATEKAAAEAADTHVIRRASENATLASIANNISRQIEKALQEVADWMGDTTPVKFQINTDYIPQKMESGEVSVYMGMVQAGMLSWTTLIHMMRDRGALDPTLQPEEEMERIKEDDKRRDERAAKAQEIMLMGQPKDEEEPSKSDE